MRTYGGMSMVWEVVTLPFGTEGKVTIIVSQPPEDPVKLVLSHEQRAAFERLRNIYCPLEALLLVTESAWDPSKPPPA